MQNTKGVKKSNDRNNIDCCQLVDTQPMLSEGYLETAMKLYTLHGFGIFFEGIQPKLVRAAVNHSVTFYVYNLLISW